MLLVFHGEEYRGREIKWAAQGHAASLRSSNPTISMTCKTSHNRPILGLAKDSSSSMLGATHCKLLFDAQGWTREAEYPKASLW